jgi:protein-glutamine gamma-glutamyltransferase
MQVERMLQISLAALTSLGTLLLGMGERNLTLPVLAVIVAGSSVYLTDVKGWLRLNALVTNIAGAVALAFTLRDWSGYASEGLLLSAANLLIYLQFVLLYRTKTIVSYWFLLLLSLLQVAVASALNLNLVFGLLLPVYMFVGLVTMSLFVIYRDSLAYIETGPDFMDEGQAVGEAPAAAALARISPPARFARGAAAPTVFSGKQAASAVDHGLSWRFSRQMLCIGAATLAFSMAWFLGLPRFGKRAVWRPGDPAAYATVGFNENVKLGEMGAIFENREEVMQVKFIDERTGDPYRIAGDAPLFRGSVLYGYKKGQWERRHAPLSQVPLPITDRASLPTDQQRVQQSVQIAPRAEPVLFSVFPIYATMETGLKYGNNTEQIFRTEDECVEPMHYELMTTAFRDHIPQPAIPAAARLDETGDNNQRTELTRFGSKDSPEAFAGLRTQAATVTAGMLPGQRELKARALESYLRDSGFFQYSLQPPQRDPGLDPIEDFLTLHRSGHCEYFASALTLMLRSQRIPARLAIGFKGGIWNSAAKCYRVQELHAHAWVEAYLEPSQLPLGLTGNVQAQENGAWLILDPTPSSREELTEAYGAQTWRQFTDLTQFLWTNYVLGLDSQRQQEAIFQPLIVSFEETLRKLRNEEERQQIWQRFFGWLGSTLWPNREWTQWDILLISMVGLLLSLIVYSGGRRLAGPARRVWRRYFRSRIWAGRRGRRVEFYERFESLLARHGMSRAAHQTPREFAVACGGQLAESPAGRGVAQLPRRIAEAYYQARYGSRDLDNAELQTVEQALSALAQALR